MDFIISNMPWVWFAAFILLLAVEAFTMALTTIWGAIAAFFMIFAARFADIDIKFQIILFLVITVFLMLTTRPFAVKKLKLGKKDTNVNSLPGQEVIVTTPIERFKKGEAKSKNGVIWSAASSDEESEISAGTVCVITEIEGNTIKIRPKGENGL